MFIPLFLSRPQGIWNSRWRILGKFLVASLTDSFQMAIFLEAIGRVDSTLFLGMALQFWMSSILNLAIAQHFLVTLFVRADYQLLNIALREVIEESKNLSYYQKRRGAFMTRCCYLADQVEDIARVQDELQLILKHLYEVFDIQGLIVYVGYYLSFVATTYLTYSAFKYGYTELGMTLKSITLALIWCIFYYLDAIYNFFTTLSVQDGHRKMIRLLEERTLFASGLDVRLEQSFESLQLQFIRNPLKWK
ncbi:putative gustatory receptor 36c [Drosophila serrata]|uniref:putative gustatory receptor 36c n=1 Tax=Drosophila serrata TaxID=7274 RepID=UPI000A1D0B3E|nr:putative gustatory receptor 36c [Drosophila serrata]